MGFCVVLCFVFASLCGKGRVNTSMETGMCGAHQRSGQSSAVENQTLFTSLVIFCFQVLPNEYVTFVMRNKKKRAVLKNNIFLWLSQA